MRAALLARTMPLRLLLIATYRYLPLLIHGRQEQEASSAAGKDEDPEPGEEYVEVLADGCVPSSASNLI